MNVQSPYAKTIIARMMKKDFSYEDAERYVAEASYEQLNIERAALTRSFIAAVESFGRRFGLEDEEIVKLVDEMMGKTDDLTITTMMKNAYGMVDPVNQSREAAIAIYEATASVHNQWVVDNSNRFLKTG